MSITKNVSAKFAVAMLAAAMMFSAFASTANAQSVEDMSLEELLALVAKLQAEVGTGDTVSSDACPYTWTRTLKLGSTGADVMQLQKFLNSMPETQVAPAGQAGSKGMETSYFGPATGAAVANFQMKYRAEILSPLGLVNATTFFGASTMAQANKLCATGSDNGDDDDDTTSGELSGDASIDEYDVDTGEEDELQEGDTAEVAELTVSFEDGDAEISRLDIILSNSSSVDPWDVFEEFALMVDGDEVATAEAGDDDDYRGSNEDTIRFSGLDVVAEEDEEVVVVVVATAKDSIDSGDQAGTWTLTVDNMRWFDADGVATDEDDADGDATFTVEEAGFEEELTFRKGDNEATTVVVDKDTARTRNVEVMQYEIEAEGGDIELDELALSFTYANASSSSSFSSILENLWIEVDGEKFKAEEDFATSTNATGTAIFTFDIDGDITIDEDDTVDVVVMVDIKGANNLTNFLNGTTLKAEVTSANADATKAEGADDLDGTQISGSAVGETHTLVAEGIVVPADSFDVSVSTIDEGRVGVFKLSVDVRAEEGDFYLDTATMSTWVTVEGGAASTTVVVDEGGAEETAAGVYEIREGTTETFEFTVTVDPTAAGSYRVILDEVEYSADPTGVAATTTYTLTPASDFRSGYQAITN